MSTFIIDEEIDKMVDKLADQLKARLKKLVERGEKIFQKQYIASQKETARAAKASSLTSRESMARAKVAKKKDAVRKAPRRESEYAVSSDDSFSDSD